MVIVASFLPRANYFTPPVNLSPLLTAFHKASVCRFILIQQNMDQWIDSRIVRNNRAVRLDLYRLN